MSGSGHHRHDDVRPLVRRFEKVPAAWQRRDLLDLVRTDRIRVLNLRYAGFGGKLRELRVPVTSAGQAERVLAVGERVDGSSLFPGLFEATESDLYVVPVYRWAFRNPWAPDELDVVCRFAGRDGAPCPLTPDTVLARAAEALRTSTGLTLRALAELEFYLILPRRDERFTGKAQRNYHQSAPYLHGRPIADEILRVVSEVSGAVKYCHGEVGYVDRVDSDDVEIDGQRAEQYELETSLVPIDDLGTWLTVARWLIRVVADRHGASVTFAPKLEVASAGSGMHLHLALEREGQNVMKEGDDLSDSALRLIGGLLTDAPALTALGNTVASSYLRLVPGHEAPTQIRWGRSDRSSLIRVPLDFATGERLDRVMNPGEPGEMPDLSAQATVEFRSPDGSAFPHLLLAAITQCVTDGLVREDGAERARALEVSGSQAAGPKLDTLPQSAAEAAGRLRERRTFFEERGFPARWIDLVAEKLLDENDHDLARKLESQSPDRVSLLRQILHKDLHKH